MGFSGMNGRIYFINEACPGVNFASAAGAGSPGTQWQDEVTKFSVTESVNKREYGHDKSQGWQDVCAGIRKLSITLDAVMSGNVSTQPLRSGRVVWLQLYPAGTSGTGDPLEGYAMVDQISYTYDQERGEPISYTMSLSSKGPWTGFTDTGLWGGFECAE
jgi:hypothetical protein